MFGVALAMCNTESVPFSGIYPPTELTAYGREMGTRYPAYASLSYGSLYLYFKQAVREAAIICPAPPPAS